MHCSHCRQGWGTQGVIGGRCCSPSFSFHDLETVRECPCGMAMHGRSRGMASTCRQSEHLHLGRRRMSITIALKVEVSHCRRRMHGVWWWQGNRRQARRDASRLKASRSPAGGVPWRCCAYHSQTHTASVTCLSRWQSGSSAGKCRQAGGAVQRVCGAQRVYGVASKQEASF